ncbi:DUF6146 family protein [Leptobacterium sp. I13]|uniref:DUF6146 family protein n=1 Tax=Leptobacterium meishanense TaxID=3128904 RepID=UPI0030EE2074
MKYIVIIGAFFLVLWSCSTSGIVVSNAEKEAFNKNAKDTIHIANDSLEYEIIIIEPGFNYWLNSIAKPRGYYTQSYLENRNQIWVNEWNQRVLQSNRFNPNLYMFQIDYEPQIDYGYEVNYQLYYYFVYFQRKYNQRLSGFVPRI